MGITMAKIGRSKITELMLNILVVLMTGLVGILAYWQIKEYQVLTPLEGNYEIEKTEYCQGDSFNIRLVVEKHLPYKERVLGRFIDGVIFSVPANHSNFAVGSYNTIISSVDIPETLPEGNYVYEEEVIYRVNLLREVSYTFTTEEFRVVNCD